MSYNSTEVNATPFEDGMYIGINLQDILYGVELVLYFRTMGIFLARRCQPHKSDLFYAIFSTVMLILTTVWVAALSTFGRKMWLLNRDYPGGPMAYHKQITDALMIYRCRIVWASHRIVVLPSLLWLANLGLGILLNWSSSTPGTTFFSDVTAEIALAYFSSSTFLNVILSCMICYRLLCHARTVKEYLGMRHASPYIAIVSIVVESVLPFTLSSIAFLITYGMKSQKTVVFTFIHPLVMCVSPQVLILRIAKAEAWRKDDETGPPESIIRIVPDSASGDTSRAGQTDVVHLELVPSMRQQPGREDDRV